MPAVPYFLPLLVLPFVLGAGCMTELPSSMLDMSAGGTSERPDLALGLPSACTNGNQDGDETDIDCGGSCAPCGTGMGCFRGLDCASKFCINKACAAPTCDDGAQNGGESDVDCGSVCQTKCPEGKNCGNGPDCASLTCVNGVCGKSPCENRQQDGLETDVDCGGPVCDKCQGGRKCSDGPDCVDGTCVNNVCKSTCPLGMGDCDGNAANGCETDHAIDPRHCGACERACAMNMPVCQAGACVAPRCPNAIDFAPRMDVRFGSRQGSIAAGDLDGDGKPDLAMVQTGADTVSVVLNRGGGVFGPEVRNATGKNPVAIAIGELNGDGRADIAVACNGGNNIGVLLNQGGGAFAPRVDYGTVAAPGSVAIGDLNEDGRPDLVTCGLRNGTLSLLFNIGAGAFGPNVDYINDAAKRPYAAILVDVDGDGKSDVATANDGLGTIGVLSNIGGGKLAAKVDYLTANAPIAISSADLNHDAKPDIVVIGQGNVSVHLNMGGAFAARADYPVVGPIRSAIADFDVDGKPDIVAITGLSVATVLQNKGGGTFGAGLSFPIGSEGRGLAIADFDQDGRPDIAASWDGGYSVLLNRCH